MSCSLDRLLQQRKLMLPAETDAFRLVPEGTLWPGVTIDALAGRYLVSLRGVTLPKEAEELLTCSGADCYVKQLQKKGKQAPIPLNPPRLPTQFYVRECGVRLQMDMLSGYSQGLFIDQRNNRAELRSLCSPGTTLLNLFAYTGAFSVYAALSGAVCTTLDLSQNCLDCCRKNMTANGISPSRHFFCRGDALHWLACFARSGRRFSRIVLDPPTFSRDAHGRVWRAAKDYPRLIQLAVACLEPGGIILCTANSLHISQNTFSRLVAAGVSHPCRLVSRPMPPDFLPQNYLKTIWIHT